MQNWKMVCDRGIINTGNLYRFAKVMQRAKAGEKLKIGFIGGSITQGSLATQQDRCYAYLVYSWWKEQFAQAEFEYINAGIGATTSQFAVARIESDLLRYEPDVVFLEFSVNDTDNDFFKETFEGVVRKILTSASEPALFMFNNVQYNDGVNAQRVHNAIGTAYDLPIVSMKNSIYEEIVAGNIAAAEITPDNLHPNDKGHRMVADVICNLLSEIRTKTEGLKLAEETDSADAMATNAAANTYLAPYQMPEQPVTPNRYINSKRYQNQNMPQEKRSGFTPDTREQYGVADIFKNGYTACEQGAYLETTVECSRLAVQFRRTITQPAPIAKAVVDGNEDAAVVLDGNFDETWGDCIYLKDIATDLPYGTHTLRIELTKVPEQMANDFYFISVITA
ncbi:MAG: SGNH/GDSL hydrolase family protein [Lachnospiraceae bacterium]|nr:SGNH/GDSL hydrolase family protein [Lachnospiraceae bacterium]